MDKGAATAASCEQDDSAATAEVLLRSETFQQRMERARRERERILRQSPPEPGRQYGGSDLSKPWDRQDRMLGSPPPARATGTERRPRAVPDTAAAVPLFLRSDAEALEAPPQITDVAANRPSARPRRISLRIALGFVLGVTAGLVISRLPLPSFEQAADQPPPEDLLAARAAVPVPAPVTVPVTVPVPAPVPAPVVAAAPKSRAPAPRPPEPAPTTATEPNLGSVKLSGTDPAVRLPAADASHRIAAVALLAAPSLRDEPAPSSDTAPTSLALSATAPSSLGGPAPPERAPTLPNAPIPTVGLSPHLLATPQTDPAPAEDIAALPPKPAPEPTVASSRYADMSIHLHSATSDPAPTENALAVLSAAGAPVADQDTVGFKVSASHLRYYHSEDAGVARDLAQALQIEARDFTSRADPPPSGFIEIWLAGPGAGATPAPTPTKKKTRTAQSNPSVAQQAEAEALKQRLILMLQSGGSP